LETFRTYRHCFSRLDTVYDEDNRGIDDCLGKCEIDIEGLDLDGTPLRVEKAIDNKRGIGFFSRTATIFLEIKFTS